MNFLSIIYFLILLFTETIYSLWCGNEYHYVKEYNIQFGIP